MFNLSSFKVLIGQHKVQTMKSISKYNNQEESSHLFQL